MTRKPLALTKRFKIMKRDGFKCCLCGRAPATTPGLVLEVDHIHPVSKGGSNHSDNLHTVCFDCNRGKQDTPLIKTLPQNQKLIDNDIHTLTRATYNLLDPYHRIVCDVLEEKGLVHIIDGAKA